MSAPPLRRVLLTGGTGLLGSYLVRALHESAAYTVRATCRPSSNRADLTDLPDVEWVTGDLDDPDFLAEALTDVDAVVHAAGLVSYTRRDRQALRRVNVEFTAALTEAALQASIPHFVHVSSVAAISPAQREAPLHEAQLTFHPQPDTSRYARSKFEGELEVWRAAEEGLGITILNPSVVLGVGDWQRSSAQLFDWVARGQTYYPPGGTGYVDARDVAAFAKTCLDAGPAGRRYIVNAENWPFERFFRTVAQALDVEPPRTRARSWQAALVWRGAAVRSLLTDTDPLLTKQSARRAMQTLTYDNAASLEAGAQYRPLRQSIWDVARAYADSAFTTPK